MQKVLINDIGYLPLNNRVPIISKIRFWKKCGLDITIFCTPNAKEVYEAGVPNLKYMIIPGSYNPNNTILLIPEYLKRNFIALLFLLKTLNKFDTIYSLSAVLDLLLYPFLVKIFDKKMKWCVVFDNAVDLGSSKISAAHLLAFIFFTLSLPLVKKADVVFTISEDLKAYLISRGCEAKKVISTGNAVENDLIEIATENPDLITDALYVGRISEAKGIYDLLRVLEIVKYSYPNFQLALIGTGYDEILYKYKNKIKDLNLDNNIQFLGFKSGLEKFNFIKSAKMLISLSPNESFGVALLEAVCSGIKVVAYDLPIYSKIYTNNEIVVVPINDFRAAAKEVVEIMDSRNFKNIPGKLLLKRFSWNTIANIERNNF